MLVSHLATLVVVLHTAAQTAHAAHPTLTGITALLTVPVPHPHVIPSQSAIAGLQSAIMAQLTPLITLFKTIAIPIAAIGCVCLGIMYTGAIIPGLKPWKDAHPTAASGLLLGIFVLTVLPALVGSITLS